MTEISKDPRKSGFTELPIDGTTKTNTPFSEKINFVDSENLPNTKDIPVKKLKEWEEQKEKFKENFNPDNPPPMLLE